MEQLNEEEKQALVLCLIQAAITHGEQTLPIITRIAVKLNVEELFKTIMKECDDIVDGKKIGTVHAKGVLRTIVFPLIMDKEIYPSKIKERLGELLG